MIAGVTNAGAMIARVVNARDMIPRAANARVMNVDHVNTGDRSPALLGAGSGA
ncbi:hypothetical protein ABZV34_30890 [Streptomyces sp. NPDC005195]|uniref:hypothetical protein n=1 Tax=Streptomyces sp. NPDC005195 TaxID=3154561 RepID=UPI0033BDFFE5